ncbi:MAG: hypothetical protein HQM08_16730 [Candidatus Riflebacteria bacterium]|nr:hypothetical protein [Candidatus Riflebacteria bacterium]
MNKMHDQTPESFSVPCATENFAADSLRLYGLLSATVLAFLTFWLPLGKAATLSSFFLWSGYSLTAIAVVRPTALEKIWARLKKVSLIIAKVQIRLLLTIVFALVVVPLGLLKRAVGHDRLGRKYDPTAKSYKVPVKPGRNGPMTNQY